MSVLNAVLLFVTAGVASVGALLLWNYFYPANVNEVPPEPPLENKPITPPEEDVKKSKRVGGYTRAKKTKSTRRKPN